MDMILSIEAVLLLIKTQVTALGGNAAVGVEQTFEFCVFPPLSPGMPIASTTDCLHMHVVGTGARLEELLATPAS
jgi:hypothetical protein